MAKTVIGRTEILMPRVKSAGGFSLLEVVISMAILTIGLISLLGVFGIAMAATQGTQQDMIAKQLADEALESIAMLLGSALDHDAAHVWLRRPDRSLRRHAAYPADRLASATLWENDHSAIRGALHERRLVRVNAAAEGAWIPAKTREALVVPLRADPKPLGVLVLARAETPYGLDDIEMADVLGTFIGRVVTSRSVTDVESDVELAESH